MRDTAVIFGPGRAGLAIGYALWQAEALERLTCLGRHREPPAHPLFTQGIARYRFGLARPEPGTTAVFLTVPDDALPSVVRDFAALGDAPTGCALFHASGALSADVLAPLHERGYHVGTFHPLQALAHPITGAERLPGSWISLSGGREALAVARRLTSALGCRELVVGVTARPLYHAGAVAASNFVATVVALGARLMVHAGIDAEDAVAALLPLARGTLANLEEMGVAGSLTGPVSRGDVETVRLHLRSLPIRERRVYAVMAREVVELAESVRAEGVGLAAMKRLLEEAIADR